MTFLTNEQLKALSHEGLYNLFKKVRAQVSYIYNYYGHRCCEMCHEYVGDDWYSDVVVHAKPWNAYLQRVQAELQSRPYKSFSKRGKAKAHRQMLADLHGNRQRPRNRQHRKAVGYARP